MPDQEAMLEDRAEDQNSDCRHCQEGGESESRYWDIQLDRDLLETICSIYPEWFKDCDMNAADGMCMLSSSAKDKEALKVKLMLRRPLNPLVDQGILPTLKSPFQEQRLERTKVGDMLKHKLQKKPDQIELIQQHVLEDDLKQDILSQPDDPDPPRSPSSLDDDESESEVASPPLPFTEHSQGSLSPSVEPALLSPGLASFSMSPSSSVSSPVFPPILSPNEQVAADLLVQLHHHSPAKRKKTKQPKVQQPKAKTIKFHEYRGPPNAPKSSSSSAPESSSELWLQQQQLFLRLQQECLLQNNHSSTLQKSSGDQSGQNTPEQQTESPNSPQKLLLSNFEDLKVTDLRAELKKKGLPVSGSKPQLIQRLRSHTPHVDVQRGHSMEQQQQEVSDQASDMSAEQLRGVLDTMEGDSSSLSNEDIVQLQQIWIEKLQRDLERSRKQLQQCQVPVSNDKKAAQRQIIHQILQQKIQQQELQKAQQRGPPTLTALLQSGPLNARAEDDAPFLPAEDEYPGVVPIFGDDAQNSVSHTVQTHARVTFSSSSVGKSSLTDFSADSPFQLPPPDYTEATRQMKIKQPPDSNPRHSKKHKSVKSQAVDDVLEILISNGELSPSAAQEPVLFPPKEAQSLLDLTPPSSTGFSAAASLDFDFPLDMTDIDAMELSEEDPLLRTTDDDRMRGGLDPDIIEFLGDFEESGHFSQQASFGDPLFCGGDFCDELDFKTPLQAAAAAFLPPWGENAT